MKTSLNEISYFSEEDFKEDLQQMCDAIGNIGVNDNLHRIVFDFLPLMFGEYLKIKSTSENREIAFDQYEKLKFFLHDVLHFTNNYPGNIALIDVKAQYKDPGIKGS